MGFDDIQTQFTSVDDLRKAAEGVDGPRTASLVVVNGVDLGKLFRLEGAVTFVGRSIECGIRLEEDGVSRRHARLEFEEHGEPTVVDLDSTNGTFVNGEKVSRRELVDGDKILFGTSTVLQFSYNDPLVEAFLERQYKSATRDALTGCVNRGHFDERLRSEIAFARRHGVPLSVALIDLDHFKRINDTWGHDAGDQVLSTVARRVQAALRGGDLLARYGGEEFVLLMRSTDAEAAWHAMERLRTLVEALKVQRGQEIIPVTMSAGVVTWPGQGEVTGEQLLLRADEAVYEAKSQGRNCVCVARL